MMICEVTLSTFLSDSFGDEHVTIKRRALLQKRSDSTVISERLATKLGIVCGSVVNAYYRTCQCQCPLSLPTRAMHVAHPSFASGFIVVAPLIDKRGATYDVILGGDIANALTPHVTERNQSFQPSAGPGQDTHSTSDCIFIRHNNPNAAFSGTEQCSEGNICVSNDIRTQLDVIARGSASGGTCDASCKEVDNVSLDPVLPGPSSGVCVELDASFGAWEKHTKGIGSKMLQKYGFNGRLGAEENGIDTAIQAKMRPAGVGIGCGPGETSEVSDAVTTTKVIGVHYLLKFDSVCRGNPGVAAGAAILWEWRQESGETTQVWMGADYFGNGKTNNEAGYRALVFGLRECIRRELGRGSLSSSVCIQANNELVIKQMNGDYRVKNASLQPLYTRATELVLQLRQHCSVQFDWVPREQNRDAARAAAECLAQGDPAVVGGSSKKQRVD
mgnify:FL=1